MPLDGWRCSAMRRLLFVGPLILLGCRATPTESPVGAAPDPAGRARALATYRLAQDAVVEPRADNAATRPPVRPIIPAATTQPTKVQVEQEIPDPVEEVARIDGLLAQPSVERLERDGLERLRQRVAGVLKENSVRLSLAEVVRRTLQNSYGIQVQSYNPAIDATRIVEAEAQFDAVFFNQFNYQNQDIPSASVISGTQTDTRVFSGGVRKLLSTGTRVQAGYSFTRYKTNLSYYTLNPSFSDQFTVEFQQPLLRGFGLDFNRAQIELNRLGRRASVAKLDQEVRETLFNVEQAYWRLLQARRSVTIQARLLEDLQTILEALKKRADYDVYVIQLNQTSSQIQLQESRYIQLLNNVNSAEVALKALMNDPVLNQSVDVAIIPTDLPTFAPIVLDLLGELSAALTYRAELHQARLAIEQAQIAVGAAKNQALPKLDLLFRYIVDGLGSNADVAFGQMADNRFNEYVVGLQFEWPIGNRGPEAAIRRARLQQAQAIAAHRAQIEVVIAEVKKTILDLQSSYELIGPNYRAARASFDQLDAIKRKQETRSPANLQVELSAHQDLASARLGLLDALISYNINIIDLERRKGTLLRFNNVTIAGAEDEGYQKPYRPSSSGWADAEQAPAE